MDEIMNNPDELTRDLIVKHQSKALRDAQERFSSESIQDSFQYVEKNPHPVRYKDLC